MAKEREILFRPHRGGLSEAMAEVRAFKSRAELITFLNEGLAQYSINIDEDKFRIDPYGYDYRINWDTYIVSMEGYGVSGFTNGPLPQQEEQPMNIDEMDTLTAIQWIRGGHYEEAIAFLIDGLKRQKKRIAELERSAERGPLAMK